MADHRPALTLQLTDAERLTLQRVALQGGGHSTRARRARIVLLLEEGRTNAEICTLLSCSPQTVTVWRRRFQVLRTAGLERRSTLAAPRFQ